VAQLRNSCRLVDIVNLIVEMAKTNPGSGYTRIQGALRNLRIQVGRSTIARILADDGSVPTPNRPQRWSTFAADSFTVEVVTLRVSLLFTPYAAPRGSLTSAKPWLPSAWDGPQPPVGSRRHRGALPRPY